jgi:hypothetical protein
MLVTQSFVVAVQPDPVLKTQHKFVAEVGTWSDGWMRVNIVRIPNSGSTADW